MRTGISHGYSLPLIGGPSVAPGLLLCIGLALIGLLLSRVIGVDVMGMPKSPVSPTVVAILLGIGLRNFTSIPEWCEAGIKVALGGVLKFGIALLGIRLSLGMVVEVGFSALPIVIACIASALFVVNRLSRWLGISARLGTLIAVGTSICGATAIAAAAPCIKAKSQEVCYAISCVALFGLVGMLVYPYLANWAFGGSSLKSGLFLGTAVHDTAQVIGAGLAYEQFFNDSSALNTATVTKLLRNLFMLLVIPFLTIAYSRDQGSDCAGTSGWKAVPLFIVAFLGFSLLRTAGDLWIPGLGDGAASLWGDAVGYTQQLAVLCLTVAMAAVGLGTRFASIRNLGLMPFTVGMSAAALVGAVSFALIQLLNA